MAEVAVGSVESVLAEVRDLAGSRIAPAAAESTVSRDFPMTS